MVRAFICAAVLAVSAAVVAAQTVVQPGPTYDLVVRHGKVVDGAGNAWFYADVGVKGGRISAVGDLGGAKGEKELDAAGLVVAPGFIDVHTHVDEEIFANRAAENFVRDGVTTIISGNCGSSVTDVGAFLARVERQPGAVNHGTLIGHNSILQKVKGASVKGDLTAKQMEAAKGLVAKGMEDGAMGFSTGLIYTPGMWSESGEIIELMKVAADKRWGGGGIYATHMRNEGLEIDAAIDEALRVGKEAGCQVEISHFKLSTVAAERKGRGTTVKAGSDLTLAKVREARKGGMEVWLDQYPYTASSTTISTMLPDHLLEKGAEEAKRVLRDPEGAKGVFREMLSPDGKTTRGGRADWGYITIATAQGHPTWAGLNVKQIAMYLRPAKPGEEMLRDAKAEGEAVSLEEQFAVIVELYLSGGATIVSHSMDETEVTNILRDPLVSVARDSGLRTFGAGMPHPRSYGACSRVLGKYVREEQVISLEEAVRKMTSQPATAFRLANRGVIRVGAWADLTVFDPATVEDKATYEKPHQYPVGIRAVIVNGETVFDGKGMTAARPGAALRGPGWKAR